MQMYVCLCLIFIQVAKSVGCTDPSEVIFTSGGTEANNWIFQCLRRHHRQQQQQGEAPHIVTTSIEHPSVALPIQTLCREEGYTATYVEPDTTTGAVKVDDVIAALRPLTRLVSVMLANNETGVVQPVSAICRAVHEWADRRGIPHPALHSDAAQALGKVPVDVNALGVDLLTIAGHKFYGPRIGALYSRHGSPLPLVTIMEGGGQEMGLRSGTENTAMIAGLGQACELISADFSGEAARTMHSTCFQLRQGLVDSLGRDGVVFNCLSEDWAEDRTPPEGRLPNTCSVGLPCLPDKRTGRDVLKLCRHVVAGVGSACHSDQSQDKQKMDSVLTRSGVSPHIARCTLRLSTGRYTTPEDISLAVDDITRAVRQLQTNASS